MRAQSVASLHRALFFDDGFSGTSHASGSCLDLALIFVTVAAHLENQHGALGHHVHGAARPPA